jgi:hypothetical protein
MKIANPTRVFPIPYFDQDTDFDYNDILWYNGRVINLIRIVVGSWVSGYYRYEPIEHEWGRSNGILSLLVTYNLYENHKSDHPVAYNLKHIFFWPTLERPQEVSYES